MAAGWQVVSFLLVCASVFHQGTCHEDDTSETKMQHHILLDPDFYKLFSDEVTKLKWKCHFPPDVLEKSFHIDSSLYQNDKMFSRRRKTVKHWLMNDSAWIDTVLGACREMAVGHKGESTNLLEQLHMAEALKDFVDHIHYFYEVASAMAAKGQEVKVDGQNASVIHDIDKLDPVMLVAYSERFQDNKTTSLWTQCVDRHVNINVHHQQHCLWQRCCHMPDFEACAASREVALREMVCDKVSRRLQKNLAGHASPDMWNVELAFFDGLSDHWLDKAERLISELKNESECSEFSGGNPIADEKRF